jgi:mono/diheme cytochrome c family protein
MRYVFLLAALVSANGSDLKPGLLIKATDGELTVHFVVASPNVLLDGDESIHAQLKPTFSGQINGYLLIETSGDFSFPMSPAILIDGKDCSGKTVTLPAGERKLEIEIKRQSKESFRINLPFRAAAFAHENEPRELREDQSRDLGRRLFEDLNCGACHGGGPMAYRFTPLTDPPKAKEMRGLHPTEGCLSETPAPGAQKFELNNFEREALQLFVQTPDISLAPLIDFPRQLQQFKCTDCHSNLTDFSVGNFEDVLLEHPGLTISTNDVAELARNFGKVAAP